MITVTVCVGSSCHIKGAREMIEQFTEFLASGEFEGQVELKGSFCMERCGEGINWMIDDEVVSSPTAEAGTEVFKSKVLGVLNKAAKKRPAKGRKRRQS